MSTLSRTSWRSDSLRQSKGETAKLKADGKRLAPVRSAAAVAGEIAAAAVQGWCGDCAVAGLLESYRARLAGLHRRGYAARCGAEGTARRASVNRHAATVSFRATHAAMLAFQAAITGKALRSGCRPRC
jgi:hypothetical protein